MDNNPVDTYVNSRICTGHSEAEDPRATGLMMSVSSMGTGGGT